MQNHAQTTQTIQDSPSAELRRSRIWNWGRSYVSSSTGSQYSFKQTDSWSKASKLQNQTWSLSPRRLIPPDIGTYSWSSLWRLTQLPILSLRILVLPCSLTIWKFERDFLIVTEVGDIVHKTCVQYTSKTDYHTQPMTPNHLYMHGLHPTFSLQNDFQTTKTCIL